MASVNKVQLIGNVGAEPVVRYTPQGRPTVTLSIATTDKWKDKQTGEQRERTEWHRVVFWDRLAEVVAEYVIKGRELYVEGKNRTREWTDKDGIKRWTTEVVAQEMQMLGGKKPDSLPPTPADDAPAPDFEPEGDE